MRIENWSSRGCCALSNGVKTMVPTHITIGTRVTVQTEDGSYGKRAKD